MRELTWIKVSRCINFDFVKMMSRTLIFRNSRMYIGSSGLKEEIISVLFPGFVSFCRKIINLIFIQLEGTFNTA